MMVFQGAKLPVGPIIVNLWPFSDTFYLLNSTNFVQITWNFQRKWSLISYMKKSLLLSNIWRHGALPKSDFRRNLKTFQFFAKFWHFLPPNFSKPGWLENLTWKFQRRYSFINSTWYSTVIIIARFLHLLHSSKKMVFWNFSQFSSQIYLLEMTS